MKKATKVTVAFVIVILLLFAGGYSYYVIMNPGITNSDVTKKQEDMNKSGTEHPGHPSKLLPQHKNDHE